jgi:hypothetical protein
MEQHLAPSLVSVDFKRPYTINGIRSTHYRGTGLVVDAELGLVCVDRNTVPSALGDVNITFANTETLAASVRVPSPLPVYDGQQMIGARDGWSPGGLRPPLS